MSYSDTRLQLVARNEGKIKSYESCIDVRAWSHDVATQDRYLREWMRCDMPVCIIPMSTVLGFLRIMTCGTRTRAAPRCHPNCKSKIILESITSSCQVIRECLKADEDLENFFIEDELETSHWPCDRCLEALKNIKLFWKILLEKLFNINISKARNFNNKDNCKNCHTDSARNVAKIWQKEMLQQAIYVKSLTPQRSCTCLTCKKCEHSYKMNIKKDKSTHIPRALSSEGDCTGHSLKASRVSFCCSKSDKYKDSVCFCNLSKESKPRKYCRCVSVKVKTASVACVTSNEFDIVSINKFKTENIAQNAELEQLRKENALLKCQLQKTYDDNKYKETFYCPKLCSESEKGYPYAVLPKCLKKDVLSGGTNKVAKDAESEMVITLQNCKNEDYQHVSLLQVLHKTNDPIQQEILPNGPCVKKEDPIWLLTKVQKTLGDMVRREILLASKKKQFSDSKTSDIEASFHTVPFCKSMTSCSYSSHCTLS